MYSTKINATIIDQSHLADQGQEMFNRNNYSLDLLWPSWACRRFDIHDKIINLSYGPFLSTLMLQNQQFYSIALKDMREDI